VIEKRVMGFGPMMTHRRYMVEAHGFDLYRGFVRSLADSTVFAYSLLESYDHVLTLSIIGKELGLVKSGIMLQLEPYTFMRGFPIESPGKFLSSLYFNRTVASLYESLMQERALRLILGVSRAPFTISRIHEVAHRYGCSIGIPHPANAFDKRMLSFRKTNGREPIAVFYTRLSPSKGLYEIPYIWQTVNKLNPETKLWIMGSFENETCRRVFFKSIEDLGVRNIEYLGYLHEDTLWKVLSRAKVLIYPSHSDSFSLAVESLALGLGVVAYKIPAIKSVYGGLETVSIVGEGDMKAAAMQTSRLLRMNDGLFAELQERESMRQFLKLHGSWENVAKAEYNCLEPLRKTN